MRPLSPPIVLRRRRRWRRSPPPPPIQSTKHDVTVEERAGWVSFRFFRVQQETHATPTRQEEDCRPSTVDAVAWRVVAPSPLLLLRWCPPFRPVGVVVPTPLLLPAHFRPLQTSAVVEMQHDVEAPRPPQADFPPLQERFPPCFEQGMRSVAGRSVVPPSLSRRTRTESSWWNAEWGSRPLPPSHCFVAPVPQRR